MAAASRRPRFCSGPRPRPGPRRLGPEKAQRALPGVHHGPARRTGCTPRPGQSRKAGPPAGQSGSVEPDRESRAHRDSEERRQGQARVGQRKGSRREKAGSGRRELCSRPTAQTFCRLRPPQREPSGAAISAPFSRSRSRAPCVRAPALQGRRDRSRPWPLRGAARPASPSLAGCSLLSPRPSSRSRPAAWRQRWAAREKTLWAVSALWFPGLARPLGSGL